MTIQNIVFGPDITDANQGVFTSLEDQELIDNDNVCTYFTQSDTSLKVATVGLQQNPWDLNLRTRTDNLFCFKGFAPYILVVPDPSELPTGKKIKLVSIATLALSESNSGTSESEISQWYSIHVISEDDLDQSSEFAGTLKP